jgi:hypothetical protein
MYSFFFERTSFDIACVEFHFSGRSSTEKIAETETGTHAPQSIDSVLASVRRHSLLHLSAMGESAARRGDEGPRIYFGQGGRDYILSARSDVYSKPWSISLLLVHGRRSRAHSRFHINPPMSTLCSGLSTVSTELSKSEKHSVGISTNSLQTCPVIRTDNDRCRNPILRPQIPFARETDWIANPLRRSNLLAISKLQTTVREL